ncbi:MAG: hypothetical protein IKS10_00910 [Lachnospiraceae bacterium]|nr:hypothetical protein [Lachnospiraceae bacterium]
MYEFAIYSKKFKLNGKLTKDNAGNACQVKLWGKRPLGGFLVKNIQNSRIGWKRRFSNIFFAKNVERVDKSGRFSRESTIIGGIKNKKMWITRE